MHSGMFVFTAIERIVYGQPAAQALRTEVERLQAQRVFLRSVNIDRQRLVAEAMGHSGEDAADVITAFVADLGLPGRLADVGVTREQFAMIANHAMHDSWLHTNPRKIANVEQVLEILEAAA